MDSIDDLDDDQDTTPVYNQSDHIIPDKGYDFVQSKDIQASIDSEEDSWIYRDLFAGTNKVKKTESQETTENSRWDKYKL